MIVIAGYPRTGKTTLANQIGGTIGHTDDTIPMGWSEGSEYVSEWFFENKFDIIEGVSVPRALRKFLAKSQDKPCDKIIWLTRAHVALTPGQETMAKGCKKVWDEILPELKKRGVEIESN